LKTVRPQKGLVGSNPTPSASQSVDILSPNSYCQKASSLRAQRQQMSRAWGPSVSRLPGLAFSGRLFSAGNLGSSLSLAPENRETSSVRAKREPQVRIDCAAPPSLRISLEPKSNSPILLPASSMLPCLGWREDALGDGDSSEVASDWVVFSTAVAVVKTRCLSGSAPHEPSPHNWTPHLGVTGASVRRLDSGSPGSFDHLQSALGHLLGFEKSFRSPPREA